MKPNSHVSAIAFAVLALASTAALADNGTGFYIGAGAGYAGHRVDCDGIDSCSKSHAGFKLLGGYQITPNFAIEGSYGDLGKTKLSALGADVSLKASGFTVAALGIYPVSKETELFGKLGMHSTKTKANFDYQGQGVSGSFNSTGLLAGFGAQYKFTTNLTGRLEYEWLNKALRVADSKGDINLVTASLIYQF
jgi:OOP family OmpA-OmpF porin